MRLLGTAASAIRAQQDALDTLGNNMANLNTPGFKATQMDFAEALSMVESVGNTTAGGTGGTLSVGSGVLYNAIDTDFQQGVLAPTNRPLDLGIDGTGFFQVKLPDGTIGYTRAGALQVDGAGQLSDLQGNIVQPNISIPSGATNLAVAANGDITGTVKGATQALGQIALVAFPNPESLQNQGNNIYIPSVSTGTPLVGSPGTTQGNQVLGTIHAQTLEQSNVNLATSMVDLIQVQRAYQLNANIVSDGDQMWGLANSIRR